MPTRPSLVVRPALRHLVGGIALTVCVFTATACAGGSVAAPTVAPASGRSTPERPGSSDTTGPSDVAAELDDLLATRDAAFAEDDVAAFTRTLADPASPSGRTQLAAFRAARALRVTVSHEVAGPVDDPSAVEVTLRYRVDGVDRADRTATVRYTLSLVGDGRRVASETPTGTDPAPPWLAMPSLAVLRTEHAVVAGTAGPEVLRAAAATVDRELPVLARSWSGTPPRTLVLLPDTTAETDLLRGSVGSTRGEVAASTDGPVGADGLATGDRVLLDPDVRRRLSATGRDVVLTHELAHVAVRATLPGEAPTWLTEGYADHVGYARAGLPQRTLAAALVTAVRAGTAPAALPDASSLDPAVTDIEVGYLASWQAVETVVALRGESGVHALLRACTVTGGQEAADAACDAAMPRVLGVDRASLTRRWQERLAALAR